MEIESTMRAYLKALEAGDADNVLQLFAPDAEVVSPLYGLIRVTKFYRDLFKDTLESKITCYDLFSSTSNPAKGVAHFEYRWKLANGEQLKFECADVFEFDSTSGKIKKLVIIYDSRSTRDAFTRLKTGT